MQMSIGEYSEIVRKLAFLGLRLESELKKQLEAIAEKEERSISQICEVLLRGGVFSYKNEGAQYLQRFLGARPMTTPKHLRDHED